MQHYNVRYRFYALMFYLNYLEEYDFWRAIAVTNFFDVGVRFLVKKFDKIRRFLKKRI